MKTKFKNMWNNFPPLKERDVIYFDSACTSLKPYMVINAMNEYYNYPSCHKRGGHSFSQKTTEAYEKGRERIREYLNAQYPEEIIFTKNTTEAINLLSFRLPLNAKDIVVTTNLEHNSNFIPWIYLAKEKDVIHKIIPCNKDLTFNLEELEATLKNNRVRLVSIAHTSNLSGVTFPAEKIIQMAHQYGALVLLDGAQSITHQKIDVRKSDVDFFAFSGHKIFAPPGIGVLYGKKSLLENLPPFITGGETVQDVTSKDYVLSPLPDKFEAGIQNYPGVMGLSAALDFVESIGIEEIHKHSIELNKYITEKMSEEQIEIIGPKNPELRGNIFNFICPNANFDSWQLSQILDSAAHIMVRAGVHCVHSWFNQEHKPASVRVSFQIYNTKEEIDTFYETFKKIIRYYKS